MAVSEKQLETLYPYITVLKKIKVNGTPKNQIKCYPQELESSNFGLLSLGVFIEERRIYFWEENY